MKHLPNNKIPGRDGFMEEFYQKFRKQLLPSILKLFQNIKETGALPNNFYETNIMVIPKAHRNIVKKENYRPH